MKLHKNHSNILYKLLPFCTYVRTIKNGNLFLHGLKKYGILIKTTEK